MFDGNDTKRSSKLETIHRY